jgi:hypothetical protein
MRPFADLARMARRELLLALLDLAPPIKRRLIAAVRNDTTPPIIAFLKGHRHA